MSHTGQIFYLRDDEGNTAGVVGGRGGGCPRAATKRDSELRRCGINTAHEEAVFVACMPGASGRNRGQCRLQLARVAASPWFGGEPDQRLFFLLQGKDRRTEDRPNPGKKIKKDTYLRLH